MEDFKSPEFKKPDFYKSINSSTVKINYIKKDTNYSFTQILKQYLPYADLVF